MRTPLYKNPISLWVYCTQQQLGVYKAIVQYAPHSRQLFKITELDSCLQYNIHLLTWIINDLAKDSFEHSVLNTVYKKCAPIQVLLKKCTYPPITTRTYKDACRKCVLLKNTIMYIDGIMDSNKLFGNTIELIEDVQQLITEPI